MRTVQLREEVPLAVVRGQHQRSTTTPCAYGSGVTRLLRVFHD